LVYGRLKIILGSKVYYKRGIPIFNKCFFVWSTKWVFHRLDLGNNYLRFVTSCQFAELSLVTISLLYRLRIFKFEHQTIYHRQYTGIVRGANPTTFEK